MISLQNVSKTFITTYGDVKALKNIDMSVKKGEIFGVIGHSGAGKSTLIRCVNLLEKPTGGNITVNGEDMTGLSKRELCKRRKKIGMIFQHFHLMPSRTVFQNVALPLKSSKLKKSVVQEKVDELLTLVGLSHRTHAYPSALSGGEKQRVAIARALANDPGVLLCDEATSALDPQTTKSILRLLKDVNTKLGITIMIITHEMAVIKEICDKVAVMEGGEIQEMGDVYDIFASPETSTAKEFAASTNNLHKIYELLETNSPLLNCGENESLLKLTFTESNTKEALLYETSSEFNVKTNIIFGNIDLIQNRPLGNLVVIASGEKENIKSAIKFLSDKNVNVEVLK